MISFSYSFSEPISQEESPWGVGGLFGELHASNCLTALNALKSVCLPGIQIVQARAVPFPAYACAAALHAVHAFEDHSNIAETLSLEWVLWLAQDTQLERALGWIGIDRKMQAQRVVLLGLGPLKRVEKELLGLARQAELKNVRKGFTVGAWVYATLEEMSLCRVRGKGRL
ncbi:MAG: hypothetical protein HY393_02745 [Candidatus Diapherotrites archaeon]|nr:hypothetical protein [Candidatus Diapherotrites archaeon]